MKAAADFALCGRTPKSCSRHSDCARAQLTSGNPQRQSFVWPHRTGAACALFYDFAPFRQLAANGGGIADTFAESENLGRPVTANEGNTSGGARNQRTANTVAAARKTAGESDSAFTLPARNEDRAGHGVEVAGAGLSSAPAFPAIFRALSGSHRQATTDHPAACGTLSAGERQQLRAARLLNL